MNIFGNKAKSELKQKICEIVKYAKIKGKDIVIENLNFKKAKSNMISRANKGMLLGKKDEKLVICVGSNGLEPVIADLEKRGYKAEFIPFTDKRTWLSPELSDKDINFAKEIYNEYIFILSDLNCRIDAMRKIEKSLARYIITDIKDPEWRQEIYALAWNNDIVPFYAREHVKFDN